MHDISVGIKKRKNKKELEIMLSNNGYKILKSEYWPFLLSPFIYFVRTIQRFKLKRNKNVEITSDVNLPPYIINKLFYLITTLERLIPFKLFGSSLFIIAQKKDD